MKTHFELGVDDIKLTYHRKKLVKKGNTYKEALAIEKEKKKHIKSFFPEENYFRTESDAAEVLKSLPKNVANYCCIDECGWVL